MPASDGVAGGSLTGGVEGWVAAVFEFNLGLAFRTDDHRCPGGLALEGGCERGDYTPGGRLSRSRDPLRSAVAVRVNGFPNRAGS